MERASLFEGKYRIDSEGFLTNPIEWDEEFARAMAPRVKIDGELTPKHWEVIRFIRDYFTDEGVCPLIYQTCRNTGLRLNDLRTLFPTGYLRGACRLAGITYRHGYLPLSWTDAFRGGAREAAGEKSYHVNSQGFLIDSLEWDEEFAVGQARQLKVPGGLGAEHWKVVQYLRESFHRTGEVPTVYETCEANGIELDDLERLFPDGYHRGAIRIAGLRAL